MSAKQLDFIGEWYNEQIGEWDVKVTQIRDSINRGISLWNVQTGQRNYLFGSALEAAKFARRAIEINAESRAKSHTLYVQVGA
jgi:hypothetical protein